MDFELKAAKAKWEREQAEKKERARARLERERKAREMHERQQQALEEAQRLRRIEAAEAALRSQEQEQEDLELGDGIRYNRILQAFNIPGEGDKITLPAVDFEVLSSQSAFDKGPVFFEISLVSGTDAAGGSGRKTTHGGVMEFTAEDGFVGLPSHVAKNANLESAEEASVRVRYVRLPKGNYAKLQPEGLDFADVPNHKAVLESKLRHHAALSEGDVLYVQHGGMEYQLRVLELRPAPSVSVLETDIEVDVVGTLTDDTDMREKLVQLNLGKAEVGKVEEGKYRYYKFNVDHHLAEATSRGDTEVLIRLQIEGGNSQADADIYVAAHPVLFPSRDQHQWASHDTGTKVISLADGLLPGVYSIAVYGFRGLTSFKLDVEARPTKDKASGQKVGAASAPQEAQDGYERCSNCQQLIPARTVALHEAYCRRHNVACQFPGCGIVFRKEDAEHHVHCPKCGGGFRQEELQKHMDVFHVPHSCSCGAVLEMQEMVKHKATTCPHRSITCRFCGDIVQAGGDAADIRDRMRGLCQHESSCGSRTDECDICHRPVMLKDIELHRAAVHAGPASGPAPPTTNTPPSNVPATTIPVASNPGSNNSTEMECPLCAQKFGGVEAINRHFEQEHLVPEAPSSLRAPAEVSSAPPFSNFRQTLSVQCPICGMAVHSERDLSSHMDMVH